MSIPDFAREAKVNFPLFSKNCLFIRTKEAGVQPFVLNKAQKYIHEKLEEQRLKTGKVRAILLKGRQQGASTYVEGRYIWRTTMSKGVRAFILTHDAESTNALFEMTVRYYDNLPTKTVNGETHNFKPSIEKSNAKELRFSKLDSGYKIGTAGNKGVGRGTTLQFFHGCLSADSLIVTASGETVSMGDISVGDMVMTSSGAIAPVKHKIFTGEKQTYTLETWVSGEPIHLTANHKVLTDEGYKKLEDLKPSDFVAMPKVESDQSITEYAYELANKPRPQGGGSKHKERHTFKLDSGFGYFLGYYLAEGHVKGNESYITFTYEKNEQYIDKALSSVSGIFTSRKDEVEGNRGRTHVNGKFLTSAVNEMVGRVDSKRIPEWMLNAPVDFLDGLFRGYYDGDGSKTTSDKLSSVSIHEKISRQLHRIALMLYGASSVKRFERSRYGKKTKDVYLLRLSGNPMRTYLKEPHANRAEKSKVVGGVVYCKVKSIIPRKIEKVWDIEVDHDDHNYQTTAGVVSNSEVAFWPHAAEHTKGILQAVPDARDTEVILESTANGLGNYFHQQWKEAESGGSEYQAIFVPWFWQSEYRKKIPKDVNFVRTSEEQGIVEEYDLDDEQLYWRRLKIKELSADGMNGEKAFKQEYPMNSAEAFQTSGEDGLITADVIQKARKSSVKASGPYIVGVDPSRGGDRFSWTKRAGRCSWETKSRKFNDYKLGDGVALCKSILDHVDVEIGKRPDYMFVDAGYGADIVDRLHELGYYNVKAIWFGSTPLDAVRYANKRAEMWGEANKWLRDENLPCRVADTDSLQADLIASPYKTDSSDRIILQPKDKIKDMFGYSPDEGDSFALTFAEPVAARVERAYNNQMANTDYDILG